MSASRAPGARVGLIRRSRWCRTIVFAGAVVVVMADAGRPSTSEEPVDLAAPPMEMPALLSPGDVTRGLRLRLRAMEERDSSHRQHRLEDEPRDYDRPAAPSEGPLPPDAADGELAPGGIGGVE